MKHFLHTFLAMLTAVAFVSCSELGSLFSGDDQEDGYEDDYVYFDGNLYFTAETQTIVKSMIIPKDWTLYVVYEDGSYGASSYQEGQSDESTDDSSESITTGSSTESSSSDTETDSVTPDTDISVGYDDTFVGDTDSSTQYNGSWNYDPDAQSETDWFSISANNGLAEEEVYISYTANTNSRTSARSATVLLVCADGSEYTLNIEQAEGIGDVFKLSKYYATNGEFKEFEDDYSSVIELIDVEAKEGTLYLDLLANVYSLMEISCEDGGTWASNADVAQSTAAAVTRSYTAPSLYTRSYAVAIEAYDGYESRTAYITLKAENRTDVDPIIIVLTQEGDEVLDNEEGAAGYQHLSSEGEEFSVTFSTNMPIELSEMPDWVTLIGTRSISSYTYNFVADPFTSTDVCGRAGAITFISQVSGAELTYAISQGNAVCNIALEGEDTLTPMLSEIFGDEYKKFSSIVVAGTLSDKDLAALGVLSQDYLENIDLSGARVLDNTIPERTFYQNYSSSKALESLIMPQGITKIGAYAFYGCEYLELDITEMISEVEYIGTYAFYDCSKIKGELNFSESLTSLGSYAFAYCKSLTGGITIPSSLTIISDNAFNSCSGLTGSITLHDNITMIGERAFSSCSGITGSVTIPALVTSVSDYLFSVCSNISEVILHDGVKSIGERSFGYCSSLKSISFPSSLTSIGDEAFREADLSEGTITIPGSVTEIPSFAFWKSNITSLVLEEGIETIGAAFYGCSQLDGIVVLPSTLRTISSYSWYNSSNYTYYNYGAFGECSNLKGIVFNDLLESIGSYAFYNCSSLSGELTLPSRLEAISSSTFRYCSSLTSVVFSDRLQSISASAFADCKNIESFEFPWDDASDAPEMKYASAMPSQFTSTSSDHVIYIPSGSKSSYEASETWGSYYLVEK